MPADVDAPAAPSGDPTRGDGRSPGRAHRGRGARALPPRDWAWRSKIRANPSARRVYRLVIGALGGIIVVGGLMAVPLPGPGWLIVFIGVSLWASEFHWARRLHRFGMRKLTEWNDWVMSRGIPVRVGLFLLTCLFVNAFLWGWLRLTGIPGWVPEGVTTFLRTHLAL